MKRPVALIVNGESYDIEIEANRLLLHAIREDIGLTGTKEGCSIGVCGACSVTVDGRLVSSCLTLAVACDGKRIETIEGLAKDGALHPLQQAFIDHDAFQCGYCTPGQICSAVGLIGEDRAHGAQAIRELMSGNICRCGAYPNIVAAIEQVISSTPRPRAKERA